MVGLGTLFPLLAFLGWLWRKRLTEKRFYLRAMLLAIPLPYLALEMGWMVTEVGRQPWIVQGLMRTADAVSPLDPVQVALSLAGFFLLYSLLGITDFYLLARFARRGPEPAGTGSPDSEPKKAVEGGEQHA
jgi:cytochrome d ubiquinol oxidase subunit I